MWMLVSNPVYARAEEVRSIALFDTEELLEAYYQASLLPEPTPVPDGDRTITRWFRPDSLLWNYNLNADVMAEEPRYGLRVPMQKHAVSVHPTRIDEARATNVPINPVPPSGPCPPLTKLDQPKYGSDYL